jgi:molybdopterin converting factor small subunit
VNRYTVRLFASYAELLGRPSLDLDMPEGARVGDLVAALRQLPGGAGLPERPFVAVNMSLARADAILNVTDEVALLPPLAGG